LSEADSAGERWRRDLAAWAIPKEILERAPEPPWGFPPALFRADDAEQDTPSLRAALEALEKGGSVIDVGVGGGAASLPLAPAATSITGVDQSEAMLASFTAAATERGVSHRAVHGEWPAVAPEAGTADVVVCHHVFYNVPGLGPFVEALSQAARRRVVVEMTAVHPASTLSPLWRHFHRLERPTTPTYEDAVAVLAELGLRPDIETWDRPPRRRMVERRELVAFARRRLCLSPERDAEIEALLGERTSWAPAGGVTLWWSP
jgi:SAM-dependent methyltransferase